MRRVVTIAAVIVLVTVMVFEVVVLVLVIVMLFAVLVLVVEIAKLVVKLVVVAMVFVVVSGRVGFDGYGGDVGVCCGRSCYAVCSGDGMGGNGYGGGIPGLITVIIPFGR